MTEIRAALEHAIDLGEQGVQVAVVRDGEVLVDESIGVRDETGACVDTSTLFPIFSVSKAITVTALHIQVARGLVHYDDPVATYWPEYRAHGKGAITVRHVLTHRAGVPSMPAGMTPERLADWAWVTDELARLEPALPLGTVGYLPLSFGYILGEIVRRTDPQARSFQRFVAEEIAGELHLAGLYMGLPDADTAPVATLSFPNEPPMPPNDSLRGRSIPSPVALVPQVFNTFAAQHACVPAVGVIANARSVAQVFAMLASGGEIGGTKFLPAEQIESFLEPRPADADTDATFGMRFSVGMGGYWLAAPPLLPLDTGRRILCHTGAGGSLGWADLDRGIGVAICHNRMFVGGVDPFLELRAAIDNLG